MRKHSRALLLIGALGLVAVIVQAQLPVNLTLENGDFEDDLAVGWMTGGYNDHSVSRVQQNGNHIAELEVGPGPIGDACCDEAEANNFAYLDQLFTLGKYRCVELDFDVPLPGVDDPTEDASCVGFDRVEMDFAIVEQNPFVQKMTGVVLIGYNETSGLSGHLQVNDFELGTVSSSDFDPIGFTATKVGPLILTKSMVMPGWFHASMELNGYYFPWLPDDYTFRITARLEDNRRTGHDFSVVVDNARIRNYCEIVTVGIDINPGGDPNRIKPGRRGYIAVAILTTDDFDATTVDPVTVKFGPNGADARLYGRLEDVDGDGDIDLLLLFRVQDTGIRCGESTATLEGETVQGQHIRGEDSISTVGCR